MCQFHNKMKFCDKKSFSSMGLQGVTSHHQSLCPYWHAVFRCTQYRSLKHQCSHQQHYLELENPIKQVIKSFTQSPQLFKLFVGCTSRLGPVSSSSIFYSGIRTQVAVKPNQKALVRANVTFYRSDQYNETGQRQQMPVNQQKLASSTDDKNCSSC